MNNLRGEFTFEINGKKYEAVISLNSLRLMCQTHNVKLEELDAFMRDDSMTAICAMAYWGIRNAAMRKGKDTKLMGFDQFCALVLDDQALFESLAQDIMSTLNPETEGNG